ncbi:unnamed protein product, partial [Choristocarpus tenellus]
LELPLAVKPDAHGRQAALAMVGGMSELCRVSADAVTRRRKRQRGEGVVEGDGPRSVPEPWSVVSASLVGQVNTHFTFSNLSDVQVRG